MGVPTGLDVPIYLADSYGYLVKIAPNGILSYVAGTGNTKDEPVLGPASNSPVFPTDMAVDGDGNVLIAMHLRVYKISTDGTLSVFAGTGSIMRDASPGPAIDSDMSASGIAIDKDGNVLIADMNGFVLKVTPDGMLSVVAGSGYASDTNSTKPGPALKSPLAPWDLAVDATGNIFIADLFNHCIQKVTPDGVLSIFAGKCDKSLHGVPVPGPATKSPLFPRSLAVDSLGNLYEADGYGVVTKITPDGTLSIVAGNEIPGSPDVSPTAAPPMPGPATQSSMNPGAVAVDPAGNLFIASFGYLLRVDTNGMMTIIGGTGDTNDVPVPGSAVQSPLSLIDLAF